MTRRSCGEVRGAHYVFTVKDDQPQVRKQLKELPWRQVPVLGYTTGRGHGRSEKRVLEVAACVVPPNAVQVLQLTLCNTAIASFASPDMTTSQQLRHCARDHQTIADAVAT